MQVRRFTRAGAPTLVADIGGEPGDAAVVLLHGAGECRHVFASLARNLIAAGRFVVTLDLRGHGDSEFAADGDYTLDAYVGDVTAVVSDLSVSALLIGHRLGGLIAIGAAGSGKVSGLVLIDAGFGQVGDERQRIRSLLTSAADGYADLSEASVRIASQHPSLARQAILSRLLRLGEDGRWRWRHDPQAIHGPAERRVDLGRDVPRIESALGSLGAPALLIRTGASGLLSQAEGERLTRVLPTLQYADLSAAGSVGQAAERLAQTITEFLDRIVPRTAGNPVGPVIDPLTLRQALGCFATGVAIITTTRDDGVPVGLTANSFCSVSMDPPLVLFCIDRRAGSLAAFEAAGSYAINILPSGKQGLSNLFVRKGVDRFANMGWEMWQGAAPIIQDAMASFECERYQVIEAGDHIIFIGRVIDVWFDSSQNPLLFFQGKYRSVHLPE